MHYMIVRALDGSLRHRCDEVFIALRKPCWAFAVVNCEHCGGFLCDRHAYMRVATNWRGTYIIHLCKDCVMSFDMTHVSL